MTIPYRNFLGVGVAVGLLGAGYIVLPEPGAATLPAAPAPKAAPVTSSAPPAAPTVKPPSTLIMNRPPVPMVTRTHDKYYAPKEAETSVQTVSATTGLVGDSVDGGLPPSDDAKPGGDAQAKAAIELDGYKNVRALAKGPDGTWRGRAMRGRTEITVRVDASGSVSAD